MTLDPEYTRYPHRREGYDHDLYQWSNLHARAPVRWPGGKSVAIVLCVSLEYFPILPEDEPFRAPGHMVTPYPDYRHYTVRDYGNRVAVFRLLDAFAKAGVTASFATNAAVAERYPELIDAVKAGGHEIIAHSTDMNGTIASTLSEAEERALIAESLARLEAATGTTPKGWLSIARSQSWRTVDLLKEHGLTYCCDWVNDELPWRFNNGLINLPLSVDLSDRQIVAVQQHSAEAWARMMRDAFAFLAQEAARQSSARLLPMQLTPYIMGQPFRIAALEDLLADLTARSEAWFGSGSAVVESWEAQQ
ncbi:polysaccharide deacetylase family protein [Aurantiacibacter gangjinensis]|uniref:Chitooligosaccharide deacetylase n=1 Tax=Aurantiacibacter gangjinensis TaxID=502682 RepID=A0A0G9MNK2_9SPHN|nr:polysaccharide deacetylase family protein [Aurantiacibacter gangjinensis]APE28096.1 polysaccharide deacetylase [Aurantiacibacter gangjinensis]KLE32301.1 polysaccharide deacetylase [Aurantiacibacter gangjinensis]